MTAFVNVAVLPMATERVLVDQTILIERGRIATLGPASQVKVPKGASVINGRGKYLMPGLVEMHAHLHRADSAEIEHRLFKGLAQGVTTIRSVDAENLPVYEGLTLRFKARAAKGELWSPYIYLSAPWGPIQYTGARKLADLQEILATRPKPRLDSVAAYVAAYQAAGYDFVKVYSEAPELFDSVVAVANRVGLPIVGHYRASAFTVRYKSIEHGFPYLAVFVDSLVSRDSVRAFAAAVRRADIWVCPTMMYFSGFPREQGRFQVVKALQDSGVRLLLGTDFPGIGPVSGELEQMVAAGLTPYQALVTGTRNPAVYFGTLDETGTIAVGKRADLVLLKGNPFDDVRYTVKPAGVLLGGRWISREVIDRRLAEIK